ncbi:unnamed protein product, partial [Hydatigera taeniaeformis]|uniref:MutS_IV domain-containing protein n=1 Tax=Hydatigena taeniaeformis TaxID=6205 RepID=A0A0R3WVR7_HYDTA
MNVGVIIKKMECPTCIVETFFSVYLWVLINGVKEHLDAVEADIFHEFEEVASKVGLEPGKSIKLESAEGVGYFLRVTLKMEKQIRGIDWLKKIDIQKAGVRCRSTEMSLLNDRLIALKEEYANTQMAIVKEILTVAGEFLGDWWYGRM